MASVSERNNVKKVSTWEERCKIIWVTNDLSIYSNSCTAPAPSKNFVQVYITHQDVVLRIWKIIPPTRADSNQPPAQYITSYKDFHEDDQIREEIVRCMGTRELDYVDNLINGHIDYLVRLPRSLLLKLVIYLDLVSILKLGQVNKQFQELCSCNELWIKVYKRHCKKQVSQELLMVADEKGWKEVFFMNKLQLQVQIRRQTGSKETRFHYGQKFSQP